MNKADDPKQFVRELFDFWHKRGVSNLKIPQIAGRELNLAQLYKAVCKRGGFNRVCNNKLWKEIVNEFALPPSCTSASFTLKNHYSKYLFEYEQKYFFGKSDEDLNEDRVNIMPRKLVKADDGGEIKPRINYSIPTLSAPNVPSIKQVLQKIYEKREPEEELLAIRKYKMIPTPSEINRCCLAFESQLETELTFALNSLLLFSCNTGHLFLLEHYSSLFESIVGYLDKIIKKIPYLNENKKFTYVPKKIQKKPIETGYDSDDVFDNKTFRTEPYVPKSMTVETNKDGNKKEEETKEDGADQNKEINDLVTRFYSTQSEVGLLENARMIVHIFRNLSYIKGNEASIVKNDKLFGILMELFINSADAEITRSCLDIFANLCKVIVLKHLTDPKSFCYKIYYFLETESPEENESAIECLRNLIFCQDNEPYLEEHSKDFLNSIMNLIISPIFEVRDSILEFLCYFSDLKMTIRAAIAKHPKCIMRLVAILSSGVGKGTDKASKLAALILSNLSLAPAARTYFQPYERDLFIVASTDEHVSKLVCNILAEIESEATPTSLTIDF